MALAAPLSSHNASPETWRPILRLRSHGIRGRDERRPPATQAAATAGSSSSHGDTRGSNIQQGPRQRHAVGEPEVWARGPTTNSCHAATLRTALGTQATSQLRALCGRCLYRTLTSYVRVHDHGRFTVVLTGDIAAMWLRDSAVQMATYFPRVSRRPALRQIVEGAIRAQAYLILLVRISRRMPLAEA